MRDTLCNLFCQHPLPVLAEKDKLGKYLRFYAFQINQRHYEDAGESDKYILIFLSSFLKID